LQLGSQKGLLQVTYGSPIGKTVIDNMMKVNSVAAAEKTPALCPMHVLQRPQNVTKKTG
jgi:hypothetical protein